MIIYGLIVGLFVGIWIGGYVGWILAGREGKDFWK